MEVQLGWQVHVAGSCGAGVPPAHCVQRDELPGVLRFCSWREPSASILDGKPSANLPS